MVTQSFKTDSKMSSPKDIHWELLFAAKCQSKKLCSLLEQSHSVSPWAVSEPGRWRTSSSFLLYPSILTRGPPTSRYQWCSPLHHLGTGQESLLEWAKRTMLIKVKHMVHKIPCGTLQKCRSWQKLYRNFFWQGIYAPLNILQKLLADWTWLKGWQWQSLAWIRM